MGTPEHATPSSMTVDAPPRRSRRRLVPLTGLAVLLLAAGGAVFWLNSTEAHYERCDELLGSAFAAAPKSRADGEASWQRYEQQCRDIDWDSWNRGWWRPDW